MTFFPASPVLKSALYVTVSRFERNAVGLNVLSGVGAGADVLVNETRFLDHDIVAARGFTVGGESSFALTTSLVAGNAVGVEAGGLEGAIELSLRSCTIADNGIGVLTDLPVPPASTAISSTILWDNGDDVQLAGALAADHSDVSDGDFGTADGNLSADPLFRDAAAGDYRLSWGSPAIDAGALVFPDSVNFDMAGNVRPNDGDHDIVDAGDIGCLEFVSLDLADPMVPSGGQLVLEAWGAPGQVSLVLVSPGAFFPGGYLSTGFGTLSLVGPIVASFGPFAVSPTVPAVLQATIPSNPALIHQTVSFQALTSSAAAPKGAALSGAVRLFIVE
jgi:hypothetical protein